MRGLGRSPQGGQAPSRITWQRIETVGAVLLTLVVGIRILGLDLYQLLGPSNWIRAAIQHPNIFLDYPVPIRYVEDERPNFIFILTDDQDLHMNSIQYQPAVQRHFAQEGSFFENHFCTISICCPSRVSLLTGKAAHNTNVTDVSLPYGGYPKFITEGLNSKYLPVWLQDAGYSTYYTGKLMNGHSKQTYNKPFPNGWNGTNFLIDPGTYIYYNSTTQRNKEPPQQNPNIYSTDIIAGSAVEFLEDASAAGKPFFIGVAPIAPHAETLHSEDGGVEFWDPVPAERHRNLFPGLKVPRTPNFNPSIASGGGFIKSLERQNETVVDYNDGFFRARIQTLQAVDDLVDSIMAWMNEHPDILKNTYLIYTTDNGYHIGQHRLPPGKTCNIEEDINIPFFIRGPGIEKGKTVSYVTTHTDIVPTIFELAGMPLHEDFDGEPIPVTPEMQAKRPRKSEHVNVEFWGPSLFEGIYTPNGSALAPGPGLVGAFGPNNTYKATRIVSGEFDISYTVWCTNEHELYDMKADPYQLNNLLARDSKQKELFGYKLDRIVPRIDALLLTLKACKGQVCTRPWETLHPKGNVLSLKDAMNTRYDDFYMKQQEKVTFSECADGYLDWLEGALEPIPYKDSSLYRDKYGRVARTGGWDAFT
jgi:N-acetylglucosamine-6-sulfatase